MKKMEGRMFVYILRGGGYIKIGITANLKARFENLSGGGVPFKLRIVAYAVLDDEFARRLERDLLRVTLAHANGEWFHDEGHSDANFADFIRENVAAYGRHLTARVYTDGDPSSHMRDDSAHTKVAFMAAISASNGGAPWQVLGKLVKQKPLPPIPTTKRQLQNSTKIKMLQRLEKMQRANWG